MRMAGIIVLRILVGVAAAAFAGEAHAAAWWLIGTSSNGKVMFGDSSSILKSPDGDLRNVWILTVENKSKDAVKSAKELYAVLCSSNTIAILQWNDYDTDGSVLKSADTPQNYERVIPETLGEDIKNFACTQQDTWAKQEFSGPIDDPELLAHLLASKPKAGKRKTSHRAVH